MPKSSIEIAVPMALSLPITPIACSTFSTSRLSVSSSSSSCGWRRLARSASVTESNRVSLRNWRDDRFTDTRSGGRPASCQDLAWRQASASTQAPTGTTMPVSSSSGTKRAGSTTPHSGWRQRSSASAPVARPLAADTRGWKCSTNSWFLSARRSAASIRIWLSTRSFISGAKNA